MDKKEKEDILLFGLGYDDGYTIGLKEGQQEATDLTLAGSLIIALIAGALGILIGLNLAAF